jgi:hypothetical protein
MLRVELEAAMVDWDLVKQIQTRVRYEDTANFQATDTRILTRDNAKAQVAIRPKNPRWREAFVDATFFYTDGSSETITQRQDADAPFIINQPQDSSTLVDVTLADALERYKRISVQLGRPSAGQPQIARTVTVGEAVGSSQWSFRRANPQDIRYAYRVTSFLKDGAVREGDWVTTDNPLLIVGDRAEGILDVQVMMLGSLEEAGMKLARLELSYPDAPSWADPNMEYVFRTGQETHHWRVPMAKLEATSYTYAVTWFGKDGKSTRQEPVTTRDEILLLDPLAVVRN